MSGNKPSMFAGFRGVVDDLRLKLGKTEKSSCRPEVSLLCLYLYRLDVAIRLEKTKERVPLFEGREETFIVGRSEVTALLSA